MALYEETITADLDELVPYIKRSLADQSTTFHLEEETEYTADGVRVKVLCCERYAYSGSGRVAMTVTLVESAGSVRVIGTAAGGSSAMFFKINDWSDNNFLNTLVCAVRSFVRDHGPAVDEEDLQQAPEG